MDRFKFRVWDTEIKEYLVGCFLVGDSNMIHNSVDYESFLNKGNYIIEQCTGLSDKNGNLIYEGDIIKSPNNSHPLAVYHDITGLWRCKENRPNGIWELPLYDLIRNYAVEIISNIHEQKEEQ